MQATRCFADCLHGERTCMKAKGTHKGLIHKGMKPPLWGSQNCPGMFLRHHKELRLQQQEKGETVNCGYGNHFSQCQNKKIEFMCHGCEQSLQYSMCPIKRQDSLSSQAASHGRLSESLAHVYTLNQAFVMVIPTSASLLTARQTTHRSSSGSMGIWLILFLAGKRAHKLKGNRKWGMQERN